MALIYLTNLRSIIIVILTFIASRTRCVKTTDLFDETAPETEVALSEDDFRMAESGSLALRTYMLMTGFLANQTEKAMYSADKFEGDIAGVSLGESNQLIIKATQGYVVTNQDSSAPLNNAIRNEVQLWPGGILPYAVDSRFNYESRAIIASAVTEIQDKTCIKFVPRDPKTHNDYIYITSHRGCYSYLGRTGGKQTVSLDMFGCVYKGVAEHEFMHALGFLHEQSRTDRDDYIEILWQNIRRGLESQFKSYSAEKISDLGTKYDFRSIMHYGPKAFSKNGEATIKAKVANVSFGQREGVSENDVRKLRILYKCDDGANDVTSSTAGIGGFFIGLLMGVATLLLLVCIYVLFYRWLTHQWPTTETFKKLVTPSKWNHGRKAPQTYLKNETQKQHNAPYAIKCTKPVPVPAPPPSIKAPEIPQDPMQNDYNECWYASTEIRAAPYDPVSTDNSQHYYDEVHHYDVPANDLNDEPLKNNEPPKPNKPPVPKKPPVTSSKPGWVSGVAAKFNQ